MNRLFSCYALALSLVLVSSCGTSRNAADSALSAAEKAYAGIRDQATNVAPDEAHGIESALAAARASFGRSEYKEAAEAAGLLETRIKTLADSLPSLTSKLEADWKTLADTVPGTLKTVQKKIDDFGKPPTGAPGRTQYDGAVAQLAQSKQQWAQADSLAAQGKLAQAVSLGEQVRTGVVSILNVLQVGS